MLMTILLTVLAVFIGFFIFSQWNLKGENLSRYDVEPDPFYDKGSISTGHSDAVRFLATHMTPPKGTKLKAAIPVLRKGYEYQGQTRKFESEFKKDTANAGGLSVPGEWTIPPGCDPTKRILFIHGGAFIIGSSISHRPLTDHLARRTGCAVFSVDYRLGFENKRQEGIDDCRAAYLWILANGPDGAAPVDKLGMAGDSAGGNLILMLAHWARDTGRRPANAVYAMAPGLDATGTGPSMKSNIETDVVLKSLLAPLVKLPYFISNLIMLFTGKINPASPIASPIFDKVHNLPPTLIQVSNTEMLYSDSVRYANKAAEVSSPVTLQVWAHQIHVFQHYDEQIPEAALALDEAGTFFETHGVAADSPKPKTRKKKTVKT